MIIFSPTKTMKESPSNEVNSFSEKTNVLANEIKNYTAEELSKKLKVKNKTLDITYNYYQEFGNNYSKAYQTYDGVSFKQIKCDNEQYIQSNVYIISALYGLISGCELISKYRLDMSYPGLYKYWKEDVNYEINKLEHSSILNLASNEFSKIVATDKIMYHITFISEDKISTYETKLLRGHILNYCIENSITNYSELTNMQTQLVKEVVLIDNIFNVTIMKK